MERKIRAGLIILLGLNVSFVVAHEDASQSNETYVQEAVVSEAHEPLPQFGQPYGPVHNQTLWDISKKLVKHTEFSIQQGVDAIAEKNPQAFLRGKDHQIKKNAILNLPTHEEMALLSSASHQFASASSEAQEIAAVNSLEPIQIAAKETSQPAAKSASGSGNKYTLEQDHSYATWGVNHFGFSKVTGKVKAEGTLMLNEANLNDSSVNVTLHMNDLETGVSAKFDDMLKSSKFFNVGSFPTATFVSSSVEGSGQSLKVHGTLTLHGIAKPVTLTARVNKIGAHPYYGVQAAGFSAVAHLKRSDFGLSAYSPGVSDEVEVEIEVEAKKSA